MNNFNQEDTICSIITGGGMSAVAIIRISGTKSISVCNKIFSKDILNSVSHKIYYGSIIDNNKIIDEVLVSIFKGKKSFTGEESVEISCHGSIFIQDKIIQLLIKSGCRIASAGEFSMRAFKNGKLDLSQAESIADLIASETEAAHQTAINQLRGKFSKKLQNLRSNLIDFASLIELELDFSEEDVEFANREKFQKLLKEIKTELKKLVKSFGLGNVIKNGIPVAILGAPNVGKSTLLNCLVNEEKAIVSEIAGTTRDAIEDEVNIGGFKFRFIDTAGIRKTKDTIESLGIRKSFDIANESKIILFIFDSTQDLKNQLSELENVRVNNNGKIILLVNKSDIKSNISIEEDYLSISAKHNKGIDILKKKLLEFTNSSNISESSSIVTNLRHYQELQLTLNEIENIINGMNEGITGDFLSTNIRQALFHLGSITGEVTTDTLLGNIFGKFCIGK